MPSDPNQAVGHSNQASRCPGDETADNRVQARQPEVIQVNFRSGTAQDTRPAARNLPRSPAETLSRLPTGHPSGHPTGHPTGHPLGHPVGHPTGCSAGGLTVAWLVNVLAAIVTVIWAQATDAFAIALAAPPPGATSIFLIATLSGLAADGLARLVAQAPFRRRVSRAVVSDELLTGAAIVFLIVSIVLGIFGCLVAAKGLL